MAETESAPARVALVTGASRGIGRAIATRLARAGFRVALHARSEEALAEACDSLAEDGGEVVAIADDLRDPSAPERILAAVADQLAPPDVIINNAGTAPSNRFDKTTDDDLDQVLDLHVRAPFRLLRAALTHLREMPLACAVQVASTAGLEGFSFTSAYTAAKHGAVGLTRALAVEFGDRPPRVYALCPGFVDTDITRRAAKDIASRGKQTEEQAMLALGAMNHIGRMHTTEEVAAAVLHLVQTLPAGCVYNLDQDPPGFV